MRRGRDLLLEPYDFAGTLSQLDDIDEWLTLLGHSAHDRIRQYRRNIRNMIEIDASGGMEDWQATIPFAKAREVLWSYVEADEFVRGGCKLDCVNGHRKDHTRETRWPSTLI